MRHGQFAIRFQDGREVIIQLPGTSGGGAQLVPESAAALLSLPHAVNSSSDGVNLQMLIAEMQQQVAVAPTTSLTAASRPNPPSMLPADALQDVPPKPFLDYLSSIEEIWREYKYGDSGAGRPSILELDSKYGDKWRKKVRYYSMMQCFV